MTATRYDICTPRPKKDGGTYWLRIGQMFPARDGEGFSIKLDALPLPNEKGEVWIKAFVPREQADDRKPTRQQAGGAARSHGAERDDLDSIPF